MSTALMNRSLSSVDTVFLPSDPRWSFVSSSLVKEVYNLGARRRRVRPARRPRTSCARNAPTPAPPKPRRPAMSVYRVIDKLEASVQAGHRPAVRLPRRQPGTHPRADREAARLAARRGRPRAHDRQERRPAGARGAGEGAGDRGRGVVAAVAAARRQRDRAARSCDRRDRAARGRAESGARARRRRRRTPRRCSPISTCGSAARWAR